ncbi:MAG: hypothetical protein GYA87_03135 [Christensenellaceae bacterium]|nr:hypothetical protein [Christensenellaceae bacterium]
MNPIEHNLLPKQRLQKRNLKVKIDLYHYTNELYNELVSLNIIDRMKKIPQLGPIKVQKNLSKSRYDYIVLQLYLHKLIKQKLQGELEKTYNNQINPEEFMQNQIDIDKANRPTIGDLLQLLTIVYNIGHFYNTFTSSRAVIIYANKNKNFADKLKNCFQDKRFQEIAQKYIDNRNYRRLHLLNSILILEKCNQELKSVKIAKEILYNYLNDENALTEKMLYIFNIFKKVRDVSYIAYDLQISNTPFTMDICNEKSLELILKELLSFYNNRQPTEKLFKSMSKLLDDIIYNENSDAICYYQISRKMVRKLETLQDYAYYTDLFLNKNSILNCSYSQRKDYSNHPILKLTFDSKDKHIANELLNKLEQTNNVRVGYYDRYSDESTILVSIRKKINKEKTVVAFRVLKTVIKYLRKINCICPSDIRFLLITKFFLYYLFSEKSIVLKATVHEEICVLCTRGKNSRIKELEKILEKNRGTEDEQHEVKFLIKCLDNKNDVSITIPSSILVLEKDKNNQKLCEFDGMIIHPNRDNNQIIILEAKNTKNSKYLAKKCLSKKLKKLNITYNKTSLEIIDKDAKVEINIRNFKKPR